MRSAALLLLLPCLAAAYPSGLKSLVASGAADGVDTKDLARQFAETWHQNLRASDTLAAPSSKNCYFSPIQCMMQSYKGQKRLPAALKRLPKRGRLSHQAVMDYLQIPL